MTEYKVIVDRTGAETWHLNNKTHRENGPAVTYKNGAEFWYREGKIHREDGPAIIYPSGAQFWYKDGKFHRDDGPAAIFRDGRKEWYLDDKSLTEEEHREQTQPVRELSMEELESMLGYKVKIVKDKSND